MARRADAVRLIGVAVVAFAVAGCSESYQSERLYWRANRLSTPLLEQPGDATAGQVDEAVVQLTEVIEKTPGTVWAARAQAMIGALRAVHKQYPQARQAYGLVLQNYNHHQEICLRARLAIAKTFEAEKNLEEAVKAYRTVADYHPWTRPGLEAPLYLAKLYEANHEAEKARNAYERAVRHYIRLAPDAPSPEHAVQTKGYLSVAYQQLGDWTEAAEVLEEIAQVPAGVNKPLVLLSLGSVYQAKLNDSEKAEDVYRRLSTEFPEHPFGQVAAEQLKVLLRNKDASPTVSPAATP